MPVNGCERVALRNQGVFVLSAPTRLHCDLSVDGYQIEVVPASQVADHRQLLPGHMKWRDRRLHSAIFDFAVRECQKAIVRAPRLIGNHDFGKTRCVRQVTDAQGDVGIGPDPKAPAASLQHNRRTGLIVGDGALNSDSRCQILDAIAAHYPMHGRDRKIP